MAKPLKDTDHLQAWARIKYRERYLLSREKLQRMSDAKSTEDVLKLLSEFGWPEITKPTMAAVEETLTARREEAFALMRNIVKDKRLTDLFCVKYDYHNLKTLLKSEATGDNPDNLLVDIGIYPCRSLKVMLREDNYKGMGKNMADSIAEARDVLARTQNPQLLDLILDKAMYADMQEMADTMGSKFITGYVALLIDSANLRTYVRAKRMGKGFDVLRFALIPGGKVSVPRLLGDTTKDPIEGIFNQSPLVAAAQIGAQALRGEASLSAVDLACDNALVKYLKPAKYVVFGADSLIGYQAAIEAELTSVRTVIAGRIAGLPAETITERLRETYV